MLQRPIQWITFDCYGTLIDWKRGIQGFFRELVTGPGASESLTRIFERWEAIQFRMIQGPYREYHIILRNSLIETIRELKTDFSEESADLLSQRLPRWEPFSDVREILPRLQARYKLGIISNIDNDMIEETVRWMGVDFDAIVTAQQARAYKPNPAPFQLFLRRSRILPEEVLHAAFGFRYDLTPARSAGFQTAFVRRSGQTIPRGFSADVEVRDLGDLLTMLDG